MRVLDRGSLPAGGGLLDRGVDQPGGLRLSPLKAGEHERAIGRDLGSGGLRHRIGLGDQQRRPPEVAAQRRGLGQHVDADRKHGQSPGLAGELDPASCDREAGVVVPHHHSRRGREPTPAKHLLDGDVVTGEAGAARSSTGVAADAAVGEGQREAVQQQIGRTRDSAGRQRP